MLHIDQNIFEEIVRYEEGGLDDAERQALAQKLQTDPEYRRHQAYYQVVVRAIGRAALAAKMDRMQEQEPSPDDIAAVDNLLHRDRRIASWRKAGYRIALFMLVAGAFWAGRVTAPVPECPPAAPPMIEEPEIPVAASGADFLLRIPSAEMEQSERQIAWQVHDGPDLEYQFRQGNLKLFVPRKMETEFRRNPPLWIARKDGGKEHHFIKFNNRFFSLIPSDTQQPLMLTRNEEIPKLLE